MSREHNDAVALHRRPAPAAARGARAAWVLALLCPAAAGLAISADAAAQQAPAPPRLTPPVLLRFVEAEVPPDALEEGIEAVVELELTISTQGAVTDSRVAVPAGHGFDEAAVEASRRFTFEPATRDGEPVASRIRYRYVFELREPVSAPIEDIVEAPPAPGRIEGRVIGADDGRPVTDAEVVLSAEGGEARRALTSDAGRFVFDDLAPGSYRVRIFAAEHRDYEVREVVHPAEVTDVTYSIEQLADPEEFSAVAVVEPPPREVVRRTITREELTRVPGTRGDALRTVELLPGVGRPVFGTGQLIVRGSSPQDSQVFLDGTPVPLLYHFGGLTSFYNSRMIERIDFFPGNFSVRFGRKLGGVLDVAARDPATDGLHGVADVNLIDASLVVETPVTDDLSVTVAVRRSYIDFWFANVIPSDAFDVVAAPVYYDYQVGVAYRPSDRDRVRFSFYGSSDELRLVLAHPADGDPAVRGNFGLATQFHKIFARWRRRLTDDVDQDVQVSVGPTLLQLGLGDRLSFDLTAWNVDARAEWRARLSRRVRLIGGFDVQVIPFDLSYRGPAIEQQEGNPNARPLSSREIRALAFSETVSRPAAYLETDLQPIDPLRIVLGLRLDYAGEIRRWSFDPRLVTIWSLSEHDRIKAGVGIFSQPPQVQESNPDLGNPDLRPLHALHLGLGYERTLAPGITAGIETFYKQLWDRVVGTRGGLPPRFTNDGLGRIYGLELSGRVQPAGRRWFGFLSYTLSRSERRDHPGDGWRLFDFDQTHILSVAAVYRLGRGWEAGATLRLVSGNPETPITSGLYNADIDLWNPRNAAVNSRRSALFHRLDVRVEKRWTFDDWKLALYLDVQNVYNARNPEGTIYNYDFTRSAAIPGLPIIPSLGVRGEL